MSIGRSSTPSATPVLVDGGSERHVFARIGRNIGWLLGGRGFAGVVSIAYLAMAARALGPTEFGGFTLVLAYGGALASLAQFRSWQAVIRFGAVHLAEGGNDRLARLLGFTATVDLLSAAAGAVAAVLGVHLAGPLLGWTVEQRHGAALFGAVLLLSSGSTATGALRLHDRFDLLTYTEAAGPAARLAGAALGWSLGLGMDFFLAAWALAAFAEAAAGWIALLRLDGVRFSFGRSAFDRAAAENPRIWRFMLHNSFSSSLGLLWQHGGTLAVGGVGGPVAAGGFRIASKLATALSKPVDAVTRVLYPELARLAANEELATLRRVTSRVTWIAAFLAGVMVVVAVFGGATLLRLLSGREFVFAHPYLVLLSIAAAVDLCGVALEPILNAHGRSGAILAARVAGAIVYIGALYLLMPVAGPAGAAFAAIASSTVIRGVMAVSAFRWRPGFRRSAQ